MSSPEPSSQDKAGSPAFLLLVVLAFLVVAAFGG